MKHILNSRGECITDVAGENGDPIVLNQQETYQALRLQRMFDESSIGTPFQNSLGYEVSITTLYAISKRVVEQKFAQLAIADYMPLRIGENAWSDSILTYRDYALGGDFEAGNINTGQANSRLADADAGVDSLTNPVINWAKQVNWSFAELKMAARSGNWDLVTSKEKARKKNWDLGVQRIAFLGSTSNASVLGLFTQSGITTNTSLITGNISAMSASAFASLVENLIGDYRSNCNFTAWPTHFIIPELDYDGLQTLVPGTVGTYPVPMLKYLEDAFKAATRNQNFKILPCFYGDKVNNSSVSGLNTNIYTLLNFDEDSLRMDIPVDYTNTLQNTINGFQFQNVGYGQYTGPLAYRPLEMLYFTHS
jgi:Uncharacterized protein conserved in bacteria (DUF2184)